MPTMRSSQRTISIILGVAGLVGWWLLVLPQWRGVAVVRPKVVALRQQLREAHQGIVQLTSLQTKAEGLRAALKAHPRALAQERMPVILDDIAALAKARGITVDAVRPSVVKGAASAKGRGRAPPPAAADHLVIPIEILGRAGYHDIGAFVDALESAEQLYQVRALSIEAERKDPERHRVTMTLAAYLAVSP